MVVDNENADDVQAARECLIECPEVIAMAADVKPKIEQLDVRFSHSDSLPDLLTKLGVSLLISTYQTGHLVVVAARQEKLVLTFHQFERAMGVAAKPGCIAVCATDSVWFLRSAADIAAKLEPRGQFDACFLARTAHFTGDFQAHEAAWVGNDFWVVNTLFSCLCALHPNYSFAPKWRPPFISALTPDDRCHLNGMAVEGDQVRYVTAAGQTDLAQGWRSNMLAGGCVLEVPTGRLVLGGLSMPHSPRILDGRLYLLNSGHGRLQAVDPQTGNTENVSDVPGIGRGLALHEGLAFVGLSKARPSLQGVPIAANPDRLKCGLVVVDLKTGAQIAHLEFIGGVREVFDVQVLPGITFPLISGPYSVRDTGQPLWTTPPARAK